VLYAVAVMALGLWPKPLIELMDSSVAQLVAQLALSKL